MQYVEIKDRLLKENALSDEIHDFEKSSDRVRHIRRHVLPVKISPEPVKAELIRLGILLGLDLLKAWDQDRQLVAGVYVSEPFLIVDTEWLSGMATAAPPEVYLCLAKDQESFTPVAHDEANPREFDPAVFGLESKPPGMTVRYLADYDAENGGAWLFAFAR